MTARTARPEAARISGAVAINDSFTIVGSAPATEAVVVTAIDVNFTPLSGSTGNVLLFRFAGSTCNGASIWLERLSADDMSSVPLRFDPGIVLQPGMSLCAAKTTLSGVSFFVDITSSGYAIPAAEL